MRGAEVAGDQPFQQGQLSVEEMAAIGNNCYRQYLRPCPIHHGLQRHGIVFITMQYQRALMGSSGQDRRRKAAGRSTDQHHFLHPPLVPQRRYRMGGHKGPERESSQRQRALGRNLVHYLQQILRFTLTSIVYPLAGADAPKVKANGFPPRLNKGPRQRLHHFVVHGAAKQRMGVGNHGHPFGGARRSVTQGFDQASSTREGESFSLGVQGNYLIQSLQRLPGKHWRRK